MVKPKLEGRKLKRLFWDSENTPNVVFTFRTGYDLHIGPQDIIQERKIICISYRWAGESKTNLLTWDESQNDKEMLRDFIFIANQADELVAYNGDRHDIKLVRGRCLIHKLPPFPAWKSIDPYPLIKRSFGLNCYKLDYVAQLLGHGGKDKMGHEDWRKITLFNDQPALKKMGKYCCRDTEILEKVFNDVEPHIKPKSHVGIMGGGERWSCPRTGSTNVKKDKTRVSASGTITHQMQNLDDKTYYTINDSTFRQYKNDRKGV